MRKALLIIGAAIAAGCATPSHPGDPGGISGGVQAQTGRAFDIAVGQQAQVEGTPLTIRAIRVADESRCPSDVQCVWAGNAVVRLLVTTQGSPGTEISLNTGIEPKATTVAGYSISLSGLKPYPRSGTIIDQTSYVATLEVRRIPTG